MFEPIDVNNDIKSHAILSAAIAFWLVTFLIFISPFDVSDLSLMIRLILMPAYGLLFFMSYMIGFYAQLKWYEYDKSWTLLREIAICIVIYIICFLFCWWYYKTDWINGTYDIITFALDVYLPIGVILSVGMVFGRYYLNKKTAILDDDKITLRGNNKQEILKIKKMDIIAASGAQNYVDLHIMESGSYKKLVFRNTLKNVQDQCGWLIKVHRSHLVNPIHFTRWKDLTTANFSGVEIPVSKKYKEDLQISINQNP